MFFREFSREARKDAMQLFGCGFGNRAHLIFQALNTFPNFAREAGKVVADMAEQWLKIKGIDRSHNPVLPSDRSE